MPELHFHDLRHTGGTLSAATGATLKELMARLGHSSVRAAMIYQHATRDRAVAAVSAYAAQQRDGAFASDRESSSLTVLSGTNGHAKGTPTSSRATHTSMFSCVARGFKGRSSFMFAGGWRGRSLGVGGGWGHLGDTPVMLRPVLDGAVPPDALIRERAVSFPAPLRYVRRR
jgi:hypothetical protein